MKRAFAPAILLCMLLPAAQYITLGCRAEEPPPENTSPSPAVHSSPIAGTWYPGNPEEIRRLLQGYLDQVPDAITRDTGDLTALIVPHAGYRYSGLTAAYGYKLLQKRRPKRVILLGPSHHASFRGLSLGEFSSYETPLGRVPVDPGARELLAGCPLITFEPTGHLKEHSLDIQVPFLQVLFDPPPPIVPLLVGRLEEKDYPALAACLSRLLDNETVIVVSTDFTHYGPNFFYLPFPHDDFIASRLQVLDQGACDKILDQDRTGFLAYRKSTGITVCGFRPVALLLELLPVGTHAEKLFYDTSGRITGDYRNSVSYLAIAFTRPSLWSRLAMTQPTRIPERAAMDPKTEPVTPQGTCDASLSPEENRSLMRLARDTLEQYVRTRDRPDPKSSPYAQTPQLQEERGAFVTLKKNGKLRGCIGYILPLEPLYAAVQENTVNAATRDTRFPPVRARELASIHIEISVLSVPEPVPSYRDIEIGRHGIILKNGPRRAVFLPQVAPEQGWGLEETLRQLSRKAGLHEDAWKDDDTEYSVFTAEIIEEEPDGHGHH
jgi:AmmeMemoRadiSam system protein B/AmmeMemoRadiSam system protein A